MNDETNKYDFDPQIEKMIFDGIKYQQIYKSKSGARINYRAISDLEERFALKDLLNAFELDNPKDKKELFEKKEGDNRNFLEKLISLGLDPVDYDIADFVHKIAIIYHSIKDFHFSALTEDEAKETIGMFGEEDINTLSSEILKISAASGDNQDRVKKFRDRYSTKSGNQVNPE